MTLKLNGSSSGYTAIDAPAAAGSNTLVLPADNGSANEFLQTNGSGTLDWAAAGAGNLKVFTTDTTISDGTQDYVYTVGAGVEKVEIILGRVKTNGNDKIEIRLGYGGTPTYIGSAYVGSATRVRNNNTTEAWDDDDNHWQLNFGNNSSSAVFFGQVFLNNAGGNRWIMSSILGAVGSGSLIQTSQELNMGQTLNTIKLTAETSFDSGTIRVVEYRIV